MPEIWDKAAKSLLKKTTPTTTSPIGAYHYYSSDFYYSMPDINKKRKMHGVKRVLVFCFLIVLLPATLIITPLYLRRTIFANVTYPVAESDIIEIRDGMSSIFCEKHSLSMSSKFSAFQLSSKPKMSTYHKHIRLKKSLTLPDDTFEYWGFYLLKGAKVHLKFCSRYDGSRILVVKGQRELSTCGLLDHNEKKFGAGYAAGHEQVKVFFEDITEITEHLPEDVKEGSQPGLLNRKHSYNVSSEDRHMEEENHGGEADDDSNVSVAPKLRKKLKKGLPSRRQKPKSDAVTIAPTTPTTMITTSKYNNTFMKNAIQREGNSQENDKKKLRTRRKRRNLDARQMVFDQLYKPRKKREQVLDRKFSHGGNAANFTMTDESNSVSSFETGLFDCYNGNILLAEGFPPSSDCTSAHFLENGSHRMITKHEVVEDGYYYYIFYSDNDLVRNDIHAIFDIYQVSFQYSNLSGSQSCVNVTDCTFPVKFLSDEIVVVEVPTRDGIEHEEDDITYLVSTCHPRTEIYAIFPIVVLILILSCSFL